MKFKPNDSIRQHILISLIMLVFYLLTAILSPHLAIKLFNDMIPATPNILLCAVVALGLLKGEKVGGIYGMIFGFIFDVTVGMPYKLSPLVFFLCGYFARKFARPFLRRNPITAFLVSAILFIIKMIADSFCLLALWKDMTFARLLFSAALPEYVYNVLISPLILIVTVFVFASLRIDTQDKAG